jgi:hypothetical protein
MNICLYLLGKLYYVKRNKKRDQQWSSFTDKVSPRPALDLRCRAHRRQEKIEYLETTNDSGNKLKNFKFVH